MCQAGRDICLSNILHKVPSNIGQMFVISHTMCQAGLAISPKFHKIAKQEFHICYQTYYTMCQEGAALAVQLDEPDQSAVAGVGKRRKVSEEVLKSWTIAPDARAEQSKHIDATVVVARLVPQRVKHREL